MPRSSAACIFSTKWAATHGAFYGYLAPGKEPTSTAVGLLCRMYTGWRREDKPMLKGVRWLAGRGPSKSDMYYNYYATQVLHHWGGSDWHQWNRQMRLPAAFHSSESGPRESGSWFFQGDPKSATKGGRLYTTCMAIMTLEVYYRYLPLYNKRTVNDSF